MTLRPFAPGDLGPLEQTLADACTWLPLARILAEKLGPDAHGHAPTIRVADQSGLAGVVVRSGNRIRLLAVARQARGRGIGSALLAAAESEARAAGLGNLRCADEPGNYVAPGIDESDTETIAWLERRGFRPLRVNESLIIDLVDNPRVGAARARLAAAHCDALGYGIERATAAQIPSLLDWVRTDHGAAWAAEVERAATAMPSTVFVATRGSELVAFAAHDGNNRGLGWFGPAATAPEHRGRGLGAALLLACLEDVASAGHRECTISWIGPRSFYDGVATIAATRRYLVVQKPLDLSE